jgi:hypothetical protein
LTPGITFIRYTPGITFIRYTPGITFIRYTPGITFIRVMTLSVSNEGYSRNMLYTLN